MHKSLLLIALISSLIAALPLNINLGAYSPALVVGDGEISFGGKQDVVNLMAALEGAAVTSANNNVQAPVAPDTTPPAAPITPAAAFVEPPVISSQPDQVQAAAIAAIQDQGASLNDLSKDIEPRIRTAVRTVKEDIVYTRDTAIESRDLAGFDRALNYATAALKTSPEVQLGTGAEGSGVGILQKAGGTPSTAPARATKRDVLIGGAADMRRRSKVTTLYVRQIPVSVEDRGIEKRTADAEPIDAMNFNVAKAQTLALTFVEEE